MNIAGLVLAGGKSSRYGSQKLFADHQGLPLVMRSFIALEQAGIDDVYAVTNSALAPAFTNIGVPVICDMTPYKGPLIALQHAMEKGSALGHEWFQVLAGDLPYVHSAMIKQLVNQARSTPGADIVLPISGTRAQPLHALYHRRCLRYFPELGQEEKRMRALYQIATAKHVSFSADEPAFININFQSDWKE